MGLASLPWWVGGTRHRRPADEIALLRPARTPADHALAADLAGAAAGAALVAGLLPSLHEEGLQLLAIGLAALPLALRVPAAWAWALAASALAAANPRLHLYDLVRDLDGPAPRRKVFGHPPDQVIPAFVASSVVGRVDVTIGGPFTQLWENGNNIDQTTAVPAGFHTWDPRVPRGVLPDRPSIFIVGPSFQGILKASVAAGGRVRGVEINGEALTLYRSIQRTWCGGCYDGVEADAGDARRWLEHHDERFDYITLLNTFSARGDPGRRGPDPEFLHTQEAIDVYLDRLTDAGIVTWEIPRFNDVDGQVMLRIVQTVTRTLVDRGVANPAEHLLLYAWGGAYDQLMVRSTPWTPEALAATRAWLWQVGNAPIGRTRDVPTELLWTPDGVRSGHPAALAIDRMRADPASIPSGAEVLHDDRPFPFWNAVAAKEVYGAWRFVALLGTLVMAVPAAMALRHGRRTTLAVGVAALSGIGFLGWEVWWIGGLRRVVDAPLVIGVLAPLLGGAGGALLRPGRLWTAGLVVSLAVVGLNAGWWLDVAAAAPDPWRGLLAAALCGGPAVFMGGVLPQAIQAARTSYGDRGAVLAYGINGGAAAIGSTFAVLGTPALGLHGNLLAILGVYLLVVLGLRRLHA